MVPVIALVGRPNVGKSTLFNRLTRTRDAIVGDLSGLTRDRQYGEAKWQGRSYILVDTGGISGDEHGMDEKMAEQSLLAIEEADVVLFLVDAKAGFTAADQMIGEHLRKRNKRSYVVANKVDNIDPDMARAEFAPMGMGDAIPIAGAHGRGITQMLEIALRDFPRDEDDAEEGEEESFLKVRKPSAFLARAKKTASRSLSSVAPTSANRHWSTACSVKTGLSCTTSPAPPATVSTSRSSVTTRSTR
jgi:GTPase